MLRLELSPTRLFPALSFICLLSAGCIGVERENIGANGDDEGGNTTGGATGSGDSFGDGDGDGDGEGDTGAGTSSGDGDGDAGDGDGDGEAPGLPRLFIVAEGEVSVFGPDDDGIPSVEGPVLETPGAAERAAVHADRLFVAWGADALGVSVWEGADAIGAAGAADLGLDGVTGGPALDLHVGAAGQLWRSGGDVEWWGDAGSVANMDTTSATFEADEAISAVAYDPVSDRLFGASPAGLWVWEQPLDQMSAGVSPDAELVADMDVLDLKVWGTQLVAVEAGGGVHLWSDLPGLVPPQAPSLTLHEAAGLTAPIGAFLRDETLVVVDDSTPAPTIHVWIDVGVAGPDTPADVVVDGPFLDQPRQPILGVDGTLYVREGLATLAIADLVGAASPVLEVGPAAPQHVALMECAPDYPCAAGGSCAGGLCR